MSPVGSVNGVGHEVEAVQADLGGLLDDRPRGLLTLVPLVGGRADDVLGEVVDPLLQLELVLVEGEREVGHGSKLPNGNNEPQLVRRERSGHDSQMLPSCGCST